MVKTVQSTKVYVFQVLAAIFDAILNRKVCKQQHESDMMMIVIFRGIARQMGHCMGGNFNIHIWAWSASPSVQVGR